LIAPLGETQKRSAYGNASGVHVFFLLEALPHPGNSLPKGIKKFAHLKNEKIYVNAMHLEVEGAGSYSSPVLAKIRKKILFTPTTKRARASDEEQEEKNKSGYEREKVFVRRDNDANVVAQRVRVLAILALVRSTSGNAREESMNRDFNAAINTR